MAPDPVRLAEDPETAPALREDLARVAAMAPPPVDASAGLGRLEEAIAGRSGGAGGLGGAGPWVAGAALLVAVGAALYWAGREDDAAPPGTRVEAHPQGDEADDPGAETGTRTGTRAEAEIGAGVEADTEAEAEANLQAEAGADREAVAEPAEVAGAAEGARRSRRAAKDPGGEGVREEMALLARTRAALGTDPRLALSLAEEGHRRFASGLFGEEREAIAILALRALGRESDAQQRGHRFLRAHPRGPFSERVRRAIEGR